MRNNDNFKYVITERISTSSKGIAFPAMMNRGIYILETYSHSYELHYGSGAYTG